MMPVVELQALESAQRMVVTVLQRRLLSAVASSVANRNREERVRLEQRKCPEEETAAHQNLPKTSQELKRLGN